MGTANSQQVPVNVVGSSTFGIYPKISVEKTVNMYISDNWLINYAGYQLVAEPMSTGEGRAIFKSVRGNFLIVVIGASVYRYNTALSGSLIGTMATFSGEVFIDENLAGQICLVDGQDAYIYNYNGSQEFTKQTLTQSSSAPIIPGYVTYHNTFFLIASALSSINPQFWYVFDPAGTDATTITFRNELALQTKPDSAIAVKRVPGAGNNIIVFGQTVAEVWTQVAGPQPYIRVSSYNIDNGCVSVPTIAANETFVCWLGQNENNSPAIIYSNGAQTNVISTDGIDNLLSTIQFPGDSTAFFYRENGHVFYQLTFFNPVDNLSLIYDFGTKLFFHVCDENQDFYPARQIVYFNEKNYFISINDSKIYSLGQEFISYNYNIDPHTDGQTIPRIRICKTLRKEDTSTFRANLFTFWIEQGVNNTFFGFDLLCQGMLITEDSQFFIITEDGFPILDESGICNQIARVPCVDMSISKNGNQSFSNVVRHDLNPIGKYKNQIRWHRLGQANELTIQLRFYGLQRFVVQNGIVEIY